MAFEVISSTTIRRESNLRVERMEICVDTIEDLPEADSIPGCKIAQGSIAWDVSTGDFYGMASTGEWIIQSGGSVASAKASTMSLRGTTIEAEEDAYALGDIESGQDE